MNLASLFRVGLVLAMVAIARQRARSATPAEPPGGPPWVAIATDGSVAFRFDAANEEFATDDAEAAGGTETTKDADDADDTEDTDEAVATDKPSDDQEKESPTRRRRRRAGRFNEATIRRGQQFFQSSCTQCHDAQRALSKRKSYAHWLANVRRMAAKEDADIPVNQHVPIATYLASRNPANRSAPTRGDGKEAEDGDQEGDAEVGDQADVDREADDALAEAESQLPPFTLNGTVSAVWRGTDPEVENPGFFPDAWIGVEWRAPDSPVSGRVVSCTSCHGVNQGLGVELVEASATLDLVHWLTRRPEAKRCPGGLEAEIKAGRFIVPFGAYSGRVHPGALRTVTPPLMYNMGRRVGPTFLHQPVLNMPYADEGANVHLRQPLPGCGDWSATFDVYAVNGLQAGGPDVFFASRSYRDNNSNLAVGGRATIGSPKLRFGGSVASGELQPVGGPFQNYKLAGADVSFRWDETVRAYYEYAIRVEDPFPATRNVVYGNLVEGELLLLSDPQISVLARYDTLDHHGDLGDQNIERFTWGLNFGLYGGSLLIVDHEHWRFADRPSVNIMGLRWTVAF